MLNRSLLTVLAVAAISTPAVVAPSIFSPAAAQELSISIGTPPPAPMYEVVPAPRPGYVWAPGYWNWEAGRHVWHGGAWMAERPGYHWVPDRWASYHDGWRHMPGHWDRVVERHSYNHWH